MTSVTVPPMIMKHLDNSLQKYKTQLLEQVCEDFNLDTSFVLSKYDQLHAKTCDERGIPQKPRKRYNVALTTDMRCCAITRENTRCRHTRTKHSVLCHIHLMWKHNCTTSQ